MDKHLQKPQIYRESPQSKGIPPEAVYENQFIPWRQGLVGVDNTSTFASSWKKA